MGNRLYRVRERKRQHHTGRRGVSLGDQSTASARVCDDDAYARTSTIHEIIVRILILCIRSHSIYYNTIYHVRSDPHKIYRVIRQSCSPIFSSSIFQILVIFVLCLRTVLWKYIIHISVSQMRNHPFSIVNHIFAY